MGRRRHARAIVGSTVRDTLTSPSPAPTTRPLALVESGQRLTHQLRPGASPRSEPDESTPTSGRNGWARRARPAGGLGAELWVKLVDATEPAPANLAALVFLTMTTKPTFRALVQARRRRQNWGGTAVSMARWITTRGERGPRSDQAQATSAAHVFVLRQLNERSQRPRHTLGPMSIAGLCEGNSTGSRPIPS